MSTISSGQHGASLVMKLIILVTLPLMLIFGAGMGAAMFGLIPGFDPFGTQNKNDMSATDTGAEEEPYLNEAPPPYATTPLEAKTFTLEEFVINLQTERQYPVFMLLSIALELKDQEAQVRVSALERHIRDKVIIFGSSLTEEQLQGFNGMNRLRDGLWVRLREIILKDDLLNLQILKMTIK